MVPTQYAIGRPSLGSSCQVAAIGRNIESAGCDLDPPDKVGFLARQNCSNHLASVVNIRLTTKSSGTSCPRST